ncbi:MAG: hypothetical protein R6X02_24355 [Enhygromyxa sp.]
MPKQVTMMVALALTAAGLVGSVMLLASIGTPFAWSLAAACALFVAIAWAQAAALRSRGAGETASVLVWVVLIAVAVFLGFAVHHRGLADRASWSQGDDGRR